MNWYYRLDIKNILYIVVRSNTKISIILKWQADHISNRVLGCFGQVGFFIRTRQGRQ